MPSLNAFGHRWNIASDDFVFPGLTDLFARAFWVLLTSLALFVWHNPFSSCPFPTSFSWLPLVLVMIALNIASGALSAVLAVLSAQGSIMDTERRRNVPTLLYARFPVFVVEIVWAVITTVIVFNVFGNVSQICRVTAGIRIAVLLEWIMITLTLVGIVIVFNSIGGRRMDRSMVDERLHWRRRFFLCKMGQNSRVREAIDDIAALMASFFVGADFVPSDIIAGLLLLVHSPNKRVPAAIDSPEKLANPSPEWMKLPACLELSARYLAFSVAIYGWPHYVISNCACESWCLLCRQLCMPNRVAVDDDLIVLEDNCCACHKSAFALKLDADCRLCFLSFHNHLFEVPFAVLTDHKTGAIVIAVRGSASFMDLITDLSLSEELFSSVDVDSDPILRGDKELDGVGEVRVHRGMLRGARYVYETLLSRHILEDAFVQYPTYQLVVCGHSLGAGIGSLLTLLLKPKYSDIRCYAFAPPGAVISENGIPDTDKHTLSVVLGDDVIPRMTYQSIHALKTEVERELGSTDKAKYEILIKGIFKLFIAYPFELHRASAYSDTVSAHNLLHVESGTLSGGRAPSVEIDDTDGRHTIQQSKTQLRPPGRLLHLACPDKETVEIRWIHHTELSKIQLTSSLLRDHLPFTLEKALTKAVATYANGGGRDTGGDDSHIQPIII